MTQKFKLIGLNKPWKAGGFDSIYATVEQGVEDWFHCAFDEKEFSDSRLKSLFDMFHDAVENLWHGKTHFVEVDSSGNRPIIKHLILDL